MKKNYLKLKQVMVIAVFVMPTLVSAVECLTPDQATDSDGVGFAVTVQSDQGQGSIDCSAFIGLEGTPMEPITISQDKPTGTILNPIKWSLPEGAPFTHNVDVVFIGNSDGSRCTQFYMGNARSGFAAAGNKTNKPSTIVACTDGDTDLITLPTAPEPPITTTDDCSNNEFTSAFQTAIDNNPVYDWVIVGGRNTESGKEGSTAICVDRFNGAGDGIGKMNLPIIARVYITQCRSHAAFGHNRVGLAHQ